MTFHDQGKPLFKPVAGIGHRELCCFRPQTTVWILAVSFLDERTQGLEILKGNGVRKMKRGKLMMKGHGDSLTEHPVFP